MKKSDKHQLGLGQMNPSMKGEWTRDVPVLNGVAVNYAKDIQVDEYEAGQNKEIALPKVLGTDLMEQIVSLSNLEQACRRVIRNGGTGGIDKMNVTELGKWFRLSWRGLQSDLLQGKYEPSAVRLVEIPKPKGGVRLLGIPTVKDRLIQQAIHQVLSPKYEETFSPTSYGFRIGRRCEQAVRQLSHYIRLGKTYIVDIDLSKFFDEVNHDRLMSRLSSRIGDKRVLKLIHLYLQSGILKDGLVHQRIKGTPQGSPLSPLLSNIVLDELDKELSVRGHTYVRYADDIVIAVGSLQSAKRVKESITNYIEDCLKLKVNETKSRICRPLALNYLGHRFTKGGDILLSRESERRLKEKIRTITKRNRGISFTQLIKELNPVLRGWLHYFRNAMMKGKLKALDSWIRRRLRCFRLKQCKRRIGIVRFLNRQGVPRKRAWTTAISRRGWWRKSSTPACHEAMNLNWFNQQGLINLTSFYKMVNT